MHSCFVDVSRPCLWSGFFERLLYGDPINSCVSSIRHTIASFGISDPSLFDQQHEPFAPFIHERRVQRSHISCLRGGEDALAHEWTSHTMQKATTNIVWNFCAKRRMPSTVLSSLTTKMLRGDSWCLFIREGTIRPLRLRDSAIPWFDATYRTTFHFRFYDWVD